jgi:hypothetical protein
MKDEKNSKNQYLRLCQRPRYLEDAVWSSLDCSVRAGRGCLTSIKAGWYQDSRPNQAKDNEDSSFVGIEKAMVGAWDCYKYQQLD